MQIVYRVRGDVEFGKQDQISALVTGKARQIERGIDIRLNVARAGLRRCRCDADQTVSVTGLKAIRDHASASPTISIGSAPCRERGGPYVEFQVGAGSLK